MNPFKRKMHEKINQFIGDWQKENKGSFDALNEKFKKEFNAFLDDEDFTDEIRVIYKY